jgi:hypothetical protein
MGATKRLFRSWIGPIFTVEGGWCLVPRRSSGERAGEVLILYAAHLPTKRFLFQVLLENDNDYFP